jgi:hypothetical protein
MPCGLIALNYEKTDTMKKWMRSPIFYGFIGMLDQSGKAVCLSYSRQLDGVERAHQKGEAQEV